MYVHSYQKLKKLRVLRQKGYSIQELTQKLSMPKATVWHHVQGIPLKQKFLKILRSKQGGSKNRSLNEWKKARKQAEIITGKFGKFEKVLVATSLYWGEGSKGDFSLSNTDPYLIKTYLCCLKAFGVTKKDLSVHIRIFEDIKKKDAINFWAKVIDIHPSEVKSVNVLKGKKKGKLLYGMCRIRVKKGGYLLKLIKSIQNLIYSKVAK